MAHSSHDKGEGSAPHHRPATVSAGLQTPEAILRELHRALPFAARQQLARSAQCTGNQGLGQFGESASLLLALLHASNSTAGSFVELGALDGVRFSNTIMLERCWGWRGLLVEANPVSYAALEHSGRTAHTEHAAVCEAGSGNVTIVTSSKYSEMSGFLSSFRNGSMRRFARRVNLQDTSVVPCARLDVLMERAASTWCLSSLTGMIELRTQTCVHASPGPASSTLTFPFGQAKCSCIQLSRFACHLICARWRSRWGGSRWLRWTGQDGRIELEIGIDDT